MLPRLPACFTQHLVRFYHIFASAGSYYKGSQIVSIVWYEGVNGRKCKITSYSIQMAIKEDRNAKKLVYCMDNCWGQSAKMCVQFLQGNLELVLRPYFA